MNTRILLILSLFALSACNGYDEAVRKQAEITGNAQADQTLKITNEDLNKKSQEMEADLQMRQHFFESVSGAYEGESVQSASTTFKTRITLSSSVPYFRANRIRRPEEVIADLKALHLNGQIVQWDASTGATFGCIFTAVQPDLSSGNIILIASDCPNSFSLWLGGSSEKSSATAHALIEAPTKNESLAVEMSPSRSYEIIKFNVTRVQ